MKTVRAITLPCPGLLPASAVRRGAGDGGAAGSRQGAAESGHGLDHAFLFESDGALRVEARAVGYAGVVRGVFRRLPAASLGLPRAVGGGFPLVACRYARPALDFPAARRWLSASRPPKTGWSMATPRWVEQAGAKMVRYTFPGGPRSGRRGGGPRVRRPGLPCEAAQLSAGGRRAVQRAIPTSPSSMSAPSGSGAKGIR